MANLMLVFTFLWFLVYHPFLGPGAEYAFYAEDFFFFLKKKGGGALFLVSRKYICTNHLGTQ
jgi:hypothetical protein